MTKLSALLIAAFAAWFLPDHAHAQCAAIPPPEVDITDPAYQAVIVDDPYCCDTEWDDICQAAYDALIGGGPANDDCPDAIVVTNGITPFSSIGATGSDITSCTLDDANDVWFSYTATCTGEVTAATCGSFFDTSLAAFTACGGTEIACNDDACEAQSIVTFQAEEGTTYLIRVAGWDGATGSGVVFLDCVVEGACLAVPPAEVDVTSAEYLQVITDDTFCCDTEWDAVCQAAYDALVGGGPGNDECTDAIELLDGETIFTSVASTGALESSCSLGDVNDVWFFYVASCDGEATVNTCGSLFDTTLQIFSECGGTEIACNDDECGLQSELVFTVTAGTTYIIRVAGYDGATGSGVINVSCVEEGACAVIPPPEVDVTSDAYLQVIAEDVFCCETAWDATCQEAYDDLVGGGGDPPANDDCADATVVTDGTTAFSSTGATGTDETSCTLDDTNDVWFSYTATCNGNVTATTCGSEFDTSIAAFDGCGGAELVCNDDSCDLQSVITFPVVQGTTYIIRVAGYDGATGAGVLNISCSPPPANDDCADAEVQLLGQDQTVIVSGDNTGATEEFPGLVVVWEAFTISECSNVTIDYCIPGSEFEGFLYELVTDCDDILGSLLAGVFDECTATFGTLPAGTYHVPILVQEGVTPIGPYTISITTTPCTDYCDAGANSIQFEKISNVTFADMDNSSTGTAGYEDFTSVIANVQRGESYPITVTIADGYEEDEVRVWIDLDHDLIFSESELLYVSPLGVGPHSGTIAIPGTAELGSTRMRIRLHDSALVGNPTPCGNSEYGQVEDYTVNIDFGTIVNEVVPGSGFLLFPNPGNGDFTLRVKGISGSVELEVFEMTGRMLHGERRAVTEGEDLKVTMAGQLAKGAYLVRLTSANGRLEQRYIVH